MVEPHAEIANGHIFGTLTASQGTLARHSEDLRAIKERLGNVEVQVAGLAG